ncbi:hypothetical protein JAAARDRAFT_200012 [Jaapia argillacea MUCL 33604]|uniref:Uncharacterized protein n=1 Tax=Jaapia argillacea MUCL 33604 TaxID=933084 RepID=A0A067PJ49_9AGAM|nr:hypothetical protein JAAARDRAFT_200012 [Jaapia argillacea MUCL 33604]
MSIRSLFSPEPKSDAVKTALKTAHGVVSGIAQENPVLPIVPWEIGEVSLRKDPDLYEDLRDLGLTNYKSRPNTIPPAYTQTLTDSPTVIPISFGNLMGRVNQYLKSHKGETLPTSTRRHMTGLLWLYREQLPVNRTQMTHPVDSNDFIEYYVLQMVNMLLAARGICSVDPKISTAGMWTRRKVESGARDVCVRWVLRNRLDSHGPFDAQMFGFAPCYLTPEVFDLVRSWKGTNRPSSDSPDKEQLDIFVRAETIWSIILEECGEDDTTQFVITSWDQWAIGYISPGSEGNSKEVYVTPILPCKSQEPTIILAMVTCGIHRSWKEFLGGPETTPLEEVVSVVDNSVTEEITVTEW